MSLLSLAGAALVLGGIELVYGWRLAVLGVTADLLFALAAFAATCLPREKVVPVACCIGLWSDFLVGGRLGVMALGYGLGAHILAEIAPLAGRIDPGGAAPRPARAVAILAMCFAGAAVAHALPAVASALSGTESPARALARAAGVALFTALISPLLWPILGAAAGRARSSRGA